VRVRNSGLKWTWGFQLRYSSSLQLGLNELCHEIFHVFIKGSPPGSRFIPKSHFAEMQNVSSKLPSVIQIENSFPSCPPPLDQSPRYGLSWQRRQIGRLCTGWGRETVMFLFGLEPSLEQFPGPSRVLISLSQVPAAICSYHDQASLKFSSLFHLEPWKFSVVLKCCHPHYLAQSYNLQSKLSGTIPPVRPPMLPSTEHVNTF
jgi:hypothetical protein